MNGFDDRTAYRDTADAKASLAQRLACLPEAERRALWQTLGPGGVAAVLYNWRF